MHLVGRYTAMYTLFATYSLPCGCPCDLHLQADQDKLLQWPMSITYASFVVLRTQLAKLPHDSLLWSSPQARKP